jgi:hypothetical protein
VSTRIYRASWAAIALPLLVAAFTVGRPEPLPKHQLPPTFDGGAAAELAREIAADFPDRSPGSPRVDQATARVRELLETYGLIVEEQRFTSELPGRGPTELVNLVAVAPTGDTARSPEAIVVMADRDNLGIGAGLDDNASGTAALIELARELSSLTVAHTLVFVSTDGGAWGGLGAAHLAQTAGFADDVLAVVNLDTIGGRGAPRVELSGGGRNPASVLAATADASVLAQTARPASHTNAFYQLLDLALPITLYSHAPLLEAGVSTVTLTASGSRPPRPAADARRQLSPDRLEAIGRAAQALVLAVDSAAEVTRGTETYIYLGGRTLRGFAIAFLLLTALVPAVLATLDLYARLARRGLSLAPAARGLRSRICVWAWGIGLAALFTVAGAFPRAEPLPLPPDLPESQTWPSAALAVLASLIAAGWLLTRVRLVPRASAERGDELSGHLAAMVLLCAVAVLLAATETHALLFLLPSLHAWLWAPNARDSHPALRLLLYVIGLAGPIGFVAAVAVRFGLGFDAPWYTTTLFTTGAAPFVLVVAIGLWGAAAGQIGAVLFGRYSPYPTEGGRPARGVLRETIRQSVLLGRRMRGSAGAGHPAASSESGYRR